MTDKKLLPSITAKPKSRVVWILPYYSNQMDNKESVFILGIIRKPEFHKKFKKYRLTLTEIKNAK